ncbi:Aste57867_25532 [Aphanomyces stellatus]|uniref:Aste57867_25532 protein n=1 Tax=Aphanomyces stellatus TaxID=120398 RepID=A0A485LUC7_9STRA|nr:hypothetical protein As57867_025453 [Aphanomyces stellatus]VFU02155.1 Aste57867_25532 [Aphanomyces stellatus]
MVNQVAETTFKEEAQAQCVQVANNMDWQSPMMAAPACVLLIAHCMALTVNTDDISLLSSAPTSGFQYLSQPSSLRACLHQVSNATYDAMSTAQNNMLAVSLASNAIPEHIRVMYKSLTMYSEAEMKVVLPREAQIVRAEAEQCVAKAKAVEREFRATRCLLDELLSCCQVKKGRSEHSLKKKVRAKQLMDDALALEQAKLQADQVEIDKNFAEREALKRDLEYHRKPKFAEKMAGFVHKSAAVVGTLASFAAGIPTLFSVGDGGGGGGADFDDPADSSDGEDPLAMLSLPELHGLDSSYGQLLACKLGDTTRLRDLVARVMPILRSHQDLTVLAIMLTYPTYVVDDYLESNEMDKSGSQIKLAELRDEARACHGQFQAMVQRADRTRAASMAAARAMQKKRAMTNERLVKYATTARILETARATKSLIERRISATKFRQESIQQSLADIHVRCGTIDDAIKLLSLVLDHLNELCAEWNKMTHFFETISTIMTRASDDIKYSATSVEDATDLELATLSDDYKKDILDTCVKAHGRAKLINLVSSMYVSISDEFFLDDLNTLNRIMQMTPRDATQEIERREKRTAQMYSGIEKKLHVKHEQMMGFMEKHAANSKGEYLAIATAPTEKREFERQASDIEARAKASAAKDAIEIDDMDRKLMTARNANTEDAF